MQTPTDIKQPLSDALTDLEESTRKSSEATTRIGKSSFILQSEQEAEAERRRAVEAKMRKFDKLVTQAGIPTVLREATMKNSAVFASMDKKQAAYEAAKVYEEFGFVPENGRNKTSLLVIGGFRTGKSWLMTALMKSILWNEVYAGKEFSIRFCKYARFVREVQACYDPGATETSFAVMQRFENYDMLLLDDIGSLENATESDDKARLLYELIDERNDWMRRTLITSNLNMTELKDRFGERMMHRLMQMCFVVRMDGDRMTEVDL